jgi:folate-dependent phosphoribosylglycinamide formyltransferase PurN
VVCARNPNEKRLRYQIANNRYFRTIKSGFAPASDINRDSTCDLRRFTARGLQIKSFQQTFDSPKVVDYLHSIQPDLMVHIYGPLFRPVTIKTAKIGVINCHMGLLPEFRGMNAAEWSALHGYPTGNTIHFIDQGIDTGDILQFFAVDVSNCPTIGLMRAKLISLQYAQIGLVIKMLHEGKLSPAPQQLNQGKQYFKMHSELSAKVERILAGGYHPRINIKERGYVFNLNSASNFKNQLQ